MRWRRVVCWRWRWFWKAGTEAARAAGMVRQALRDPVHRYTAQGLHGLVNRQTLGAPKPEMTAAQKAGVADRGPRRANNAGA